MKTLKLTFSNNSGENDSQVSIGFLSPPAAISTTSIQNCKDGSTIYPLDNGNGPYPFAGNWYTLDELSEGVSITAFSGGRVYVAYGTPWTIQHVGYEPGQAVTDPNFYLRYDKIEMTFSGSPYDVADLTSIDYWSIPMTLKTFLSGKQIQTVSGLLPGVTTQKLFQALNALTTPPASGLPGPGGIDGTPIPALVPGQYQVYPTGPAPGTAFARIIGPSSYPPIYPAPGAIPVQPYPLFHDYLSFLLEAFGPGTVTSLIPTLGNGVIATIAGNFAGVGSPVPLSGSQSKQTYNLAATIDNNLDITLTGTVSSDPTITTTMLFKIDDLLNPAGIYGGNAPFYLNGATTATNLGNDVYGWICGDLFAGLNIGAVGSSTSYNGTIVGALPSESWFFGKLPSALFFNWLQPNNLYYNQWAATLAKYSQAYNFAFTDRFAPVLASLNPENIDTLQIVLEPEGLDSFFMV
ncbi:MAG TPA: beta-1,3-glucanase family protein [Methylobacter sp.]|jgi:hypothetical protein